MEEKYTGLFERIGYEDVGFLGDGNDDEAEVEADQVHAVRLLGLEAAHHQHQHRRHQAGGQRREQDAGQRGVVELKAHKIPEKRSHKRLVQKSSTRDF
ncbi:hypothetical protein JTE90_010842 [Oedothorax gibbosus]|uniref:Uncharacterized protein n=1 Tax=Oedothorax gibbosus TaxID=931172 RepID=A0AAV6V5J1_9ARAC|nr:hypothetical protein JTE90_010842 [Oedothorax gibbosus]